MGKFGKVYMDSVLDDIIITMFTYWKGKCSCGFMKKCSRFQKPHMMYFIIKYKGFCKFHATYFKYSSKKS